jgi:hypothetical protein
MVVNHSMINAGFAIFLEPDAVVPGSWKILQLVPMDRPLYLFMLTTYCPNVMIWQWYEEFDTPYNGQAEWRQDELWNASGDYTTGFGDLIPDANQPQPPQPVRVRTQTHGVHCYGFNTSGNLRYRGIKLDGADVAPVTYVKVEAGAAGYRMFSTFLTTSHYEGCVMIPESAYTQEIADNNNTFSATFGVPPDSFPVVGHVLGIYSFS